MPTYTEIPNGDVDPDSPLTTGLVTLLRDNWIAGFGGAAGAPKIQLGAMDSNSVDTAQIVAAAVGRSQIANSTTTSAGNVPQEDRLGFVLNDWALSPMIHSFNSQKKMFLAGHITDGGSASSPRFSFINDGGASETYDVDHRWILAA